MKTLLVIDDSVSFLDDVESTLTKRYRIIKSTSGEKGIEILKAEHVSAVLLDPRLPDMSGLELLKKIREGIDPHLPVIYPRQVSCGAQLQPHKADVNP